MRLIHWHQVANRAAPLVLFIVFVLTSSQWVEVSSFVTRSTSFRTCSSGLTATKTTSKYGANEDGPNESNSVNGDDISNGDKTPTVATEMNGNFSADELRNGYIFNGYSMPHGSSSANQRYSYSYMLDERGNIVRKLFGRLQDEEFEEDNEDGWGDMRKKKRPFVTRAIRWMLKKTAKKVFRTDKVEPGTLILVRHGESTWNANKTFTGKFYDRRIKG